MEYEWDAAKDEANIPWRAALISRPSRALSGRQPWSFPAIGAVRCDGPRSVWWATAYTTLYLLSVGIGRASSAYGRRVVGRGTDMSEIEHEVLIPSDEEEEAIQRGIASDPDAPEWTDEDWARARPAVEAVPHVVERHRHTRGRQKAPTKEKVTVRLDADIVAHFREGGRGWQTKLNEALRQVIGH